MSTYQAALNVLREERRSVVDVRDQILRDHGLEATDPADRSRLLEQTRAELSQLSRAIMLLERMQDGRLVEVMAESVAAAPVGGPRTVLAPRQTGLIKRFRPEGRA